MATAIIITVSIALCLVALAILVLTLISSPILAGIIIVLGATGIFGCFLVIGANRGRDRTLEDEEQMAYLAMVRERKNVKK